MRDPDTDCYPYTTELECSLREQQVALTMDRMHRQNITSMQRWGSSARSSNIILTSDASNSKTLSHPSFWYPICDLVYEKSDQRCEERCSPSPLSGSRTVILICVTTGWTCKPENQQPENKNPVFFDSTRLSLSVRCTIRHFVPLVSPEMISETDITLIQLSTSPSPCHPHHHRHHQPLTCDWCLMFLPVLLFCRLI
jgi:hypothetical protein